MASPDDVTQCTFILQSAAPLTKFNIGLTVSATNRVQVSNVGKLGGRTGLKTGDKLVSVNGSEVKGEDNFYDVLRKVATNEPATLIVERAIATKKVVEPIVTAAGVPVDIQVQDSGASSPGLLDYCFNVPTHEPVQATFTGRLVPEKHFGPRSTALLLACPVAALVFSVSEPEQLNCGNACIIQYCLPSCCMCHAFCLICQGQTPKNPAFPMDVRLVPEMEMQRA